MNSRRYEIPGAIPANSTPFPPSYPIPRNVEYRLKRIFVFRSRARGPRGRLLMAMVVSKEQF